MSLITQEMVDQCCNEIKEITNGDEELIQWCVDEYKNFMMISRGDYTDTLEMIINGDYRSELQKLCKYLLSRINEFGATRMFYLASVQAKDSK